MKPEEQKVYDALARPPEDAVFVLQKVETVAMPHPYCITARHVAWAADRFSGRLTLDAIRDAEKNGARCEICAKSGRALLGVDQHENNLTAFIAVPAEFSRSGKLNNVPGLHAYLLSIKAQAEALGIKGFAFPPK